MATDKEMLAWAESRDWHDRLVRARRAVRYMADVRHPLKPRRLDEPVWRLAGPRRQHEPKPQVPETAPCSKCGNTITMSKWWMHECPQED